MSIVKMFHAGQAGAPSLSGTTGSLIEVLDAVLVNGYNQVNVISVTRVANTATVQCEAPHGFQNGECAYLSGSDQSEYNGEFVVNATSDTTFTIAVAGSPASPATGTIAVKRAPAGFAKLFSGMNAAVYQSADHDGLRPCLQVVDDASTTGAGKEAKLRGYMSMSAIDVGDDPFPTEAQAANGWYAYKSNGSNANRRPWVLITDGRTFYFQACMDQAPASMMASGGYLWWFGFGEIEPTSAGDPYACFLAGNTAPNHQTTGANGSHRNGLYSCFARSWNPGTSGFSLPRSHSSVYGAVHGGLVGHGWDQNAMGAGGFLPYPHPTDNGLYITPVNVAQGGVIRGRLPGVYESLQGNILGQFDTVENIDAYPGRKFIAFNGRSQQAVSTNGLLLYDLTGPWR